jgi:hypothetical protein
MAFAARAVNRVAALAAAAVLVATGSGCGSHKRQQGREVSQLTRSGYFWLRLDAADRLQLVRFCKAPAGLAVAKGDRSVPVPYFSDRYGEVQQLPVPLLAAQISRFFAQPAHRTASVQLACSTMAQRLTRPTEAVPRAVFAAPAVRRNGPIEVSTTADHLSLGGTLTKPVTRARVVSAPDRSATGPEARLGVRGLALKLILAHIPLGRSYLQLILEGRRTRHLDVLVVERQTPASPTSGSFAPIELSGTGTRTIPRLDVPASATLSYRTDRAGLGISDAAGRVHVATDALSGAIAIAAGGYSDLQVVADGRWQLVITPRRRGSASAH